MTDLRIAERLIGGDPDGWKEIFPDYQPTDESRVQKADAIRNGLRPEDRSQIVSGNRPKAAYFLTPLSDEDANFVRQKVGLDMGPVREVRGIPTGRPSPPAGIPEAPGVSSGETVSEQQSARDPDSNTQNPEPTVDEEGLTREELDEAIEEAARLREAREARGFAVDETEERLADLERRREALADDDTGGETAEDFRTEDEREVVLENVSIPSEFSSVLNPRPNVLSEFFSYTYSVSLYLMQPEDYRKMTLTGQKKLFNSTLLVQSGGVNSPSESTDQSRRNPFFDVDFYIDNLEIQSLVTGKATQGAHNATTVRFNITEPYGISFLDRLRGAVADFRGSDQNILSQVYLLVVRFYGYDRDGNLVDPENKPEETSDSNAVIEKFIPFMWENIRFTVANRSAVYECKAVAVNQYVGLGQVYTSIPYNIEISGQTLSELLNGETVFASDGPDPDTERTPDSDGEDEASSTATLKQGLVSALNKFERQRAEETGAIPNEYAIKLDEGVKLSKAKMAQLEEAYLPNLPMNERKDSTLLQKTPSDNNQRKYSIISGQPIVQVLDLLIRSSTYITDQQLAKISEDPRIDRSTGPRKDKKYIRTRDDQHGPISWYKITTHIEPTEYDERKGEHAYKITYIVSGYQVNDLLSEFFSLPNFRGVHKKYNYWFTGENTEVLNFEQQFNSLFYLRMAPKEVLDSVGIRPRQYRDLTSKGTTQDITDQSEVMGTGESARPAADAASALYSPSDQGVAELNILGDPAWIQQNEILYNNITKINYDPFLPDDSINYDSQEPLFQISFNLPTDYDLEESGTMPVRKFNKVEGDVPGSHKFVYRANRVLSNFTNGEFTQQISATLMFDTDRDRAAEEEDRIFPLLGDDIIQGFPQGTVPPEDRSTDAERLGPRRGPGVLGLNNDLFGGTVDDD